ncbi:zinc finger CCHC domain-containing protein 8-like [Telopea speciosissima]|uniref:zinc finger CCHC domain-containing protein 8-like n=1 Tax=Telopea speciosissima TaxID=54955 RepID=UPI001CC7BBCF|nr:zinc finger CCHC domain-containing protein 8-like [Telopea speciosissima]
MQYTWSYGGWDFYKTKFLPHLKMGAEDFIDLGTSSGSSSGSEKNELHDSNGQPSEADFLIKVDTVNGENSGQVEADGGKEYGQPEEDMDLGTPDLQEKGELTEAVVVAEMTRVEVYCENGFAQNVNTIGSHRIDDNSICGVKRARLTCDDQQPSVHVMYKSLTRDSKRKLEELLQKWSEWHAQHYSSSNDMNDALESGEETYFPAINVGAEKSSIVSFRIDNQARKQQRKEFMPLDGDTVPLYDRGYALLLTSTDGSTNLESGLETFEAPRCFNCGSYNHSMKECSKPRDNDAVNSARQKHNSKRNQTSGPRQATRYYQDTPGGKYDGLRPGALSASAREAMGIGEFDPPPWLFRMREMGYPPGYLDPVDDDKSSGIKIYADEEIKIYADEESKLEQEDGEILERQDPEPIAPQVKLEKTVEFPGINAPIPVNADEQRWAGPPGGSSLDFSRNRLHQRSNRSSHGFRKGQYHDQGWSRDHRDDGPPGCDSPSISGSTSESQNPGGIPIPRSPTLGRSLSDRGRSPLIHEGSPNHSPYSSLAYSSPNPVLSPQNYSSPPFESRNYESQYSSYNSSSHRRERYNRHHQNYR